MTVQSALQFIQRARGDDELKRALETLGGGDEITDEGIVQIARDAGFEFTPDELHRAHAYDWQMRWARYKTGDA